MNLTHLKYLCRGVNEYSLLYEQIPLIGQTSVISLGVWNILTAYYTIHSLFCKKLINDLALTVSNIKH